MQEALRLPRRRRRRASSALDQAVELGEALGFYVVYGRSLTLEGWGGGLEFGNALLSRYPVLAADGATVDAGDEPRTLLYAKVATPFGELPVFVTHLSWKLHQSAEPACARSSRSPSG